MPERCVIFPWKMTDSSEKACDNFIQSCRKTERSSRRHGSP